MNILPMLEKLRREQRRETPLEHAYIELEQPLEHVPAIEKDKEERGVIIDI